VIDEKFKSVLLIGGNDQEEELLGIQKRLNHYINKMLTGEAGVINVQYLDNEDNYWSFFAPIKSVDWSFSLHVKESQIYQSVYEQYRYYPAILRWAESSSALYVEALH
jgi:hypothetical protein